MKDPFIPLERQIGRHLPDRLVWQLRYLLHLRHSYRQTRLEADGAGALPVGPGSRDPVEREGRD
jgi:hypothetical protein